MIPSLLELHMSNCQIESLPLSLHTVNFTSLSVLDMSRNVISSSFLSWVFNLTSLETLDLSYNSFIGTFPKLFGNLCSLNTINIKYNNFDGGIQEVLNSFSDCLNARLESLVLSFIRWKANCLPP